MLEQDGEIFNVRIIKKSGRCNHHASCTKDECLNEHGWILIDKENGHIHLPNCQITNAQANELRYYS